MALNLSGWLPGLLPVFLKIAGVAQTARRYVNFVGVTAVDDAANDQCTITVSGGTTPTGTGLTHVVAGVQAAAASLVVNADVDPAAALAVSKLAPAGTNGHVLTTSAGVAAWAAASGASLPTGCSTLAAVQDVATAGLTSDLALTANAFITLLRFTDGVGPSVDGLVSGGGAFRIVVILPSASSVQIVDYTTSASAAANQFETGVTLASTGAGGIWAYDPTSLRWINLGHQF